ncbi:ABC transporter ATP-binding protein [Arenicella xantha]|uniref:ABC-2 type transport system ATP-binding protein n=1 Tax=Arenicella xantha TaxID=644221 RepID=A0A395JKC0_9GAMM|nr:ABC transporter ATP-binding protein [Arenicella xantha]RBP49661.1 ABC-2 type transport system ATP-binding protein [Arenicella xantha]
MNTPTAISIQGVSKRYDDLQALNNVSFDIYQGEFFGLLGPNGAGKSTLISAIAGLLEVNSGHISILGSDVRADYRQARQKLGVVPQEIVMDPFFTVRETLEFQSGYYGVRNNTAWIDELLEQLNLSDKADTNMRKLSGGMKRRVLIAQALVHKPQVLVLDEPTAGVDVELRQSMWRFVRRLHSEGHTIVLTTHYLEEAEELCDRIAIINKGEVIALESKQDLLARGLGSKLHVRATHAIETVPEEYQSRVTRLAGNELDLTIHRDSDSVMEILDRLRAASIDIDHVSVVNDSLEDVFVRLTGNQEGK